MREADERGALLFNSQGGSLTAALGLGRLIRKYGLDTVVGGPYVENEPNNPVEQRVVVKAGICFSACVYAFLGGQTRELSNPGTLGVHQFRGAKEDSGEVVAQVTTAMLAEYLDEMGVDRKLLVLLCYKLLMTLRLGDTGGIVKLG